MWNLAELGPRTSPGNNSKKKKDAVEEIKKSGENCPVKDIRRRRQSKIIGIELELKWVNGIRSWSSWLKEVYQTNII